MMSSRLFRSWLSLLLLLHPSAIAAQRPDGPALGAALGLGWAPSFLGACSGASYDRSVRGVAAEARAALPLWGRLRLEARVAAQSAFVLCSGVTIALPHPDGLDARKQYDTFDSNFASADLRLRYDLPGAPALVLAGGAGWLTRIHAPYLAFSPGLRFGHRWRLALDADALLARVPFDRVVTDWRGNAVVGEVSREPQTEWRRLGGVRLGTEYIFR